MLLAPRIVFLVKQRSCLSICALVAALLITLAIARAVFFGPQAPAHFETTAFSDFDDWDCSITEWFLMASFDVSDRGDEYIHSGKGDMHDRYIYRLDDASGSILDIYINELVLRQPPVGSSYYMLANKSSLSQVSSVNFTGTIIFRQNVSLLVDLGFEPKRTSLRYYRGELVESSTTRSDL